MCPALVVTGARWRRSSLVGVGVDSGVGLRGLRHVLVAVGVGVGVGVTVVVIVGEQVAAMVADGDGVVWCGIGGSWWMLVAVVVVRQKMGGRGRRGEGDGDGDGKNAKAPTRTALRRGTIRGDECLLYLSVTGVP